MTNDNNTGGDRLNGRADQLGRVAIRYGLAAFLGWTAVTRMMGGGYGGSMTPDNVLAVGGPACACFHSDPVSAGELAVAVLIAARPVAPAVSALGSAAAVGLLGAAVTGLAGVSPRWSYDGSVPLLTPDSQSRLKDVVLLGAALVTLAESVAAAHAACPCHRAAAADGGCAVDLPPADGTEPPAPTGDEPQAERPA